jgi:hypothetical protein
MQQGKSQIICEDRAEKQGRKIRGAIAKKAIVSRANCGKVK